MASDIQAWIRPTTYGKMDMTLLITVPLLIRIFLLLLIKNAQIVDF